jgi:periplasmic divalent cation tolerance protein
LPGLLSRAARHALSDRASLTGVATGARTCEAAATPVFFREVRVDFILVYVTFPSAEVGERIAAELLDARLVACVNFFPIESRYRWRGKIERGAEIAAIMKTVPERWDELCAAVTRLHPYEVPCIVRVDGVAAPLFGAWLRAETTP